MLGLASGGVFPYFFATGKTVYASTEPTLYVSPAQKEGTMNATLMQAGPRWIDAGGARIVDAAGLDTEPAPGVFVYTGAYDFQAFYLDDALLPFSYSPVSNPSAVEESSPYAANSLTKSTSGPATLLSNYSWPDLGLTKTVRVDPSGTVHIGLDFQFVKAFPRSIEVRLFAYPGTTLLSTQNSSGKYSVGLSEAYADLWVSEPLSSEVSITESNISLSSVDFLPSDELGIPELQFFLNSTDTAPRDVQANLTIQTAGLVISAPELVTESKWFRSVGASWVVAPLDSGTALIDRLLEDPALLLYPYDLRLRDLPGRVRGPDPLDPGGARALRSGTLLKRAPPRTRAHPGVAPRCGCSDPSGSRNGPSKPVGEVGSRRPAWYVVPTGDVRVVHPEVLRVAPR